MGGSSGGGGSSGKVDYPSYMKDRHKVYLNEIKSLLPAPNPFAGVNAPAITRLTNNTAIEYLDSYLDARISEVHELPLVPEISICFQQPQFYGQVMQMICLVLDYLEAHHNISLSTDLSGYEEYLADRLDQLDALQDIGNSIDFETVVRPRFLAGMRDVNAVQSSTFIIGLSVMEGVYMGKVTEFREQLKADTWKMRTEVRAQIANLEADAKKADTARIQSVLTVIGQLMSIGGAVSGSIDQLKVQLETALQQLRADLMKMRESSLNHLDSLVDASAAKNIELSRMQIVAAFEQSNVNIDYDEKQYRWDLENYQYLANMLAAIGSGTVTAGGRQTSKFSSALGGALSGASAGMAVSGGNPIGAGIGAAIGLGASLLG